MRLFNFCYFFSLGAQRWKQTETEYGRGFGRRSAHCLFGRTDDRYGPSGPQATLGHHFTRQRQRPGHRLDVPQVRHPFLVRINLS